MLDSATENLLWDVIEEHLDEAQYACEQLEVQLGHATLTLSQVERGIEERLHAHVDGLVVAGEVVARELLQPVFADSAADAGRMVVASLALSLGASPKLAAEALLRAEPQVRSAALRGIQLVAGRAPAWLQAWASDRFAERGHAGVRDALMPLVAACLSDAQKIDCLHSDDLGLVAATVRALTAQDASSLQGKVEQLLEHESSDVVRAALMATLTWGSARAYQTLREQALSGEPQTASGMALYAAVCGPAELARLVELLPRAELRCHVLFALGFSGNSALVPTLIEHLSSTNKTESKLAAQSIATITGLDTQDDAYCLQVAEPGGPTHLAAPEEDPEALATLPALEDDDLDADLVPLPEDALPAPDPAAVLRQWQLIAANFNASERYVLGVPLSMESMLHALSRARMRTRYVLAQGLSVRTNGQCTLDTGALASQQRRHLEALRALPSQLFRHSLRFA